MLTTRYFAKPVFPLVEDTKRKDQTDFDAAFRLRRDQLGKRNKLVKSVPSTWRHQATGNQALPLITQFL